MTNYSGQFWLQFLITYTLKYLLIIQFLSYICDEKNFNLIMTNIVIILG